MLRLDIDADTWAELSALLDAALDVPPPQRDAWLAQLDARHDGWKPWLRERLERAATLESDFLATLPRLDVELPAAGEDGAPGERIGPYRLVRELGRGGMGSVWLAERADHFINRPVALKFPRGRWIREGLRERMGRERQILASLEHAGIARLYDAGLTESGDPYLAIEYVEGRPLDEYCAAERPGVRERLALFLQVADAVAYAHSKLIVHRDLKPANILVTGDGQVRLLDFGIGTLIDEHQTRQTPVTELSGRALTPDYASPEQIAGAPLTVGTDIYSLGVVLYELLTGQRPYRLRRDSRGALEDAILDSEPQRPSQVVTGRSLRSQIEGDLDAIVLKALKKTAAERYATVHAFAEDVRRCLAGQPVQARPDSRAYRARKFLVRHKLAAGAAAAAGAAIVSAAGVALWQAELARREGYRAERVTQFIASIFQGVDPNLLGAARPVTAVELLDQAQDRVTTELAGQPDLQARLRTVMARSYLGLFEPARARDLLDLALADAGRLQPPDPDTLRPLQLLMAQALVELNRPDEADEFVALVLGSLDEAHPDATYVEAKVTESAAEYRRGQYDRASLAAEAAHAAASRLMTLDAAALLDVQTALGKAAGMQRRTQESLDFNARALALALRAFDDDRNHPKVLEAEHNYAASLIDVGRIDDAIPHLRQSLAAAQAAYGERSLIAGQYAVRLGLVLMERGDLEAAIELIDAGIRIEGAFELGATPSQAGRQRTLARAYMAARRMNDATSHIDAALDILRASGAAPFLVLVLEADRAFAAGAASGAIAPSIARLVQIIDEQDRGDQRYKTHLPDIYAGMLHLWNGDAASALRHLTRGVELARAQTRASDLGEALVHLGLARLVRADAAGADEALREGLERLRQGQQAVTPFQAEAWLGLGRLALANGRPDAAVEHLERAAAFWASFDPDNRGAGETAFWLARALAGDDQPDAAARTFDLAVHLLAKSPIPADAALVRMARSR